MRIFVNYRYRKRISFLTPGLSNIAITRGWFCNPNAAVKKMIQSAKYLSKDTSVTPVRRFLSTAALDRMFVASSRRIPGLTGGCSVALHFETIMGLGDLKLKLHVRGDPGCQARCRMCIWIRYVRWAWR